MIKAIIFDWDGVIADSIRIVYNINQDIIKKFGGRPFADLGDFREKFADWRGFYQQLDPANPNSVEDTMEIFRNKLKKSLQNIELYYGIDNVIRKLSKKYKLGIVSHNLRDIIESKLKEHNLLQFFDSIVDGTVENIKPHPEPINICMAELGVEPHETCMIGDFHEDIETARNANLAKVIAVSYGLSTADMLQDADIVVHTPEEIIDAVEGPK
jgi:HAD superfamily hydrolase (TIGR01549 family)